jgi:hypothetical protein
LPMAVLEEGVLDGVLGGMALGEGLGEGVTLGEGVALGNSMSGKVGTALQMARCPLVRRVDSVGYYHRRRQCVVLRPR